MSDPVFLVQVRLLCLGVPALPARAPRWRARCISLLRKIWVPRSPESICPPVGLQTGHTYERANIEAHLARSKRAPVAGIELTDTTLMPNIALREAIEAWHEERRAANVLAVVGGVGGCND